MKESFIVYHTIEEVLNELTDEEVGQLFRGMVQYSKTQNPVGFDGKLKIAWLFIKGQMDRDLEKYEKIVERNQKNGSKGGRPKNDEKTQKTERFFEKPKKPVYVYEYEYEYENDIDSRPSSELDALSISSSAIAYLNDQAGTGYQVNALGNLKLVSDLLQSGYTDEQIRRVIDRKCDEWLGDPKMEQYLRPSTLFKPSNFEKYLNAPDTARTKAKEEERAAEARKVSDAAKLEAAKTDLVAVREKIAKIKIDSDEAFEERRRLKDQESAILSLIEKLGGDAS